MATLSEHESKQLLAGAGVPVPDERLATTAGDAAAAARELGFPVAVKLCGRALSHKTERDLVRLGLADAESVEAAARDLLARARAEDGDVSLLVAPMVAGRRELIAGLVRDDQFGPCVMLGVGGVFAEALGDVAFAVAPLAPGDALELVDALQNQKLLGPLRGEPAVDRARLAGVLEALGRLGTERADIRSIDLNPLIVREGEPVVVDALVELEGPSA